MTVHVAGAGLAGLAAACTAARAGHEVVVHEAAGIAGGRCRSFFDAVMERVIDNGTHVVLGANRATLEFLDVIGAADAMVPAVSDALPFVDLEGGATWSVDVAGYGISSLLKAAPGFAARAGLVRATLNAWMRSGATVADLYGDLPEVYARLIVPLCTAVMNRAPEETPAAQFARLIGDLAGGGRGALRPLIARANLAEAFVLPSLHAIREQGGQVHFHDPLTEIETSDHAAHKAVFRSGPAPLGPHDALVLALPPWALDGLLPRRASNLIPHHGSRAIVCAHFATERTLKRAGENRLTGCTGGLAQWFAATDGMLSITVSAADRWMVHESDDIAARLWRDAATVFGLPPSPVPRHRVIKERRATAEIRGGFGPKCEIAGIFFAGGWTSARYPDTIEAAVASGIGAARSIGPPD